MNVCLPMKNDYEYIGVGHTLQASHPLSPRSPMKGYGLCENSACSALPSPAGIRDKIMATLKGAKIYGICLKFS